MNIKTQNNFSDLQSKVVIIAGATGLIGSELSKSFVDYGATVIVSSRNKTKGKILEKQLNKMNRGKALYYPLDISKEKSVDNLIKFALSRFNKIDVFINSAWPKPKDWMKNVEEIKFDSIKKNISEHLGGYFLCTQKMALLMKKQQFGSIINFSSIYGVVGPNFSIYNGTEMTCPPAYPLIKGGIVTMTKYFATYFAKDGLRVNCVCPGGVFDNQNKKFVKNYNKLVPLGRMAEPKEIVGAVLFLSSDSASYVTGHCLVVDGGWTSW